MPVEPKVTYKENSQNVQISFEVPIYGVYSVGLSYKKGAIEFENQTLLALRGKHCNDVHSNTFCFANVSDRLS